MLYVEQINEKMMIIDRELEAIEKAWNNECIKSINRYKTKYSMFCAMGSFAVYDKYNEPIDTERLPKKLQELERIWSDMINKFNYYMTTELIEQNK